jgi:hypothetical protein
MSSTKKEKHGPIIVDGSGDGEKMVYLSGEGYGSPGTYSGDGTGGGDEGGNTGYGVGNGHREGGGGNINLPPEFSAICEFPFLVHGPESIRTTPGSWGVYPYKGKHYTHLWI